MIKKGNTCNEKGEIYVIKKGKICTKMCPLLGANRGPFAFESDALPTTQRQLAYDNTVAAENMHPPLK